jgi:hypothetical protein
LGLVLASPARAAAQAALISLRGTDFDGGARTQFGSTHYGQRHVNYVYAQPTGAFATMAARVTLGAVPEGPLVLHLLACNQDTPGQCAVQIRLNREPLFNGLNPFPAAQFQWQSFPVPAGCLTAGDNELRLTNLEPQGTLGQPPWFMLARAVIGPPDLSLDLRPPLEQDFRVNLPETELPLPTPLPEGRQPGFPLRGTKGWLWLPDQYQAELPTLAAAQGNFLMICYGSMWNLEGYPEWPEQNAWWLPLPAPKRDAYLALLRACQARNVDLCLSLNPNLSSSRPLAYGKAEDLDALWQHYELFQTAGMTWFSICLDDISQGIDAAGQAQTANAVVDRLRGADPRATLSLCPTFYWGDGSGDSAPYLETLARDLHPEIYLFWTGDAVVTPHITRTAAERYRERSGHRLIIWDNYPVNDGNPTLHLGPVTGRDRDLHEVCAGYMSNPMKSENELNRLPLLTCLDYAYNPWDYDPARAIGQAILRLGPTLEQRQTLKDLVELSPGMLVFSQGTGFNPILSRFEDLLETPHARFLADLYLKHAEDVAARLRTHFPGRFGADGVTLNKTLARMRQLRQAAYGTGP